jgi:hypothetical protein
MMKQKPPTVPAEFNVDRQEHYLGQHDAGIAGADAIAGRAA